MFNEKPKRKNDDEEGYEFYPIIDNHLGLYLLITTLIFLAMILILNMLGAAIGNIFSNIGSCMCLMASHL